MEQFEMADKLAKMTGASLAEAKAALENCGWNMLDAALQLEREGRIPKQSGEYHSSASEQREGSEKESTDGRLYAPRHLGLKGMLKWIWAFLIRNTLVIRGNSGDVIMSLPILIAAILMFTSFWTLVIVVLVSFVFGCQYSFVGPQLGKKTINAAARQVGDKVHEFGQNFKNRHLRRKNTDNSEE
ncbi:MAG: hypothetical protein IKR85_04730 [Clostridia bacterium]|nr:hypothetical protein [Clostridia bacterium]